MNTIPLMVAPFLPVLWALVASAIWWRNLSNPWLFLIAAALALLGVQAIVSAVWDYWVFPNNFIRASTTPEAIAELVDAIIRRALVVSGLVLLAAFPVLRWLKRGFACANET